MKRSAAISFLGIKEAKKEDSVRLKPEKAPPLTRSSPPPAEGIALKQNRFRRTELWTTEVRNGMEGGVGEGSEREENGKREGRMGNLSKSGAFCMRMGGCFGKFEWSLRYGGGDGGTGGGG